MIPTWAIVLDYILGTIMWTLIGRAFMNIFQREDSSFFFMRVFVKYTNPIINLNKLIIGFVVLTNILMKKKVESSLWKIFINARPIKVHIIVPKA